MNTKNNLEVVDNKEDQDRNRNANVSQDQNHLPLKKQLIKLKNIT